MRLSVDTSPTWSPLRIPGMMDCATSLRPAHGMSTSAVASVQRRAGGLHSDGSEDAERISEHRAQRDQEVVDLAAAAAASGKTLSKRQLSRKPARSASLPKPASLPWAATGDEALGDSGRPSSGALSSGCAAAESAPQPAVRQAAGVPSLLSSVVVSSRKKPHR